MEIYFDREQDGSQTAVGGAEVRGRAVKMEIPWHEPKPQLKTWESFDLGKQKMRSFHALPKDASVSQGRGTDEEEFSLQKIFLQKK